MGHQKYGHAFAPHFEEFCYFSFEFSESTQ